jgi:DNA anti-recombination protein RmuC
LVKELWHILTTVANLTKDQQRSESEITKLRQEVDKLKLKVSELQSDLENSQTTVKLVLDNYKSEINYLKEGIAAKFDVLTTRLDLKIADFESRLPANKRASKVPKLLKKPQQR